jgi:hypothetical protein
MAFAGFNCTPRSHTFIRHLQIKRGRLKRLVASRDNRGLADTSQPRCETHPPKLDAATITYL